MGLRHLLLLAAVTMTAFGVAVSEQAAEKAALLSFMSQTRHMSRVQWNASTSACSWRGVTCDSGGDAVVEIRLPAVGLVGPIPQGTIGRLSSLRVLSLRQNRLTGTLPADFANLTLLYSLYLQDNALSGGFPPSVTTLTRLNRLDLAGNNFSGEIPFAVNNLTRLTTLNLERNSFSGEIPSINISSLAGFNVSDNNLNGSVPETLDRFPASSFAGNLHLCGGPLPPCTPFFSSPSPSPVEEAVPAENGSKKKKLSTAAIIAIAAGIGGFLLLLLILIFLMRKKKERKNVPPKMAAIPRMGAPGEASSSKEETSAVVESERNRLVFVGSRGGYSFDLEDLLRASAEVLGKGSIGTSYKAVLENGTTVVVKRLKDVAVSKREFELQMEELGRIEHRNILPLRAYYYSKDEKLIVFDYLSAGSLSSALHGSRGTGRTPLDWDNRICIALAAGRGLAHLHNSTGTVHGNIKSSNVLLRPDTNDAAALTDYALCPLFGPTATSSTRIAGNRAPELIGTYQPTSKSDIYSFGVLLLELLTGKSPTSFGEEGMDLPRWVQSVVREEWTAEVFDAELMQYPNIEEEMVQLLQIAMACVSPMPDSRPEVAEVVRTMEEIASRVDVEEGRSPRPASSPEQK